MNEQMRQRYIDLLEEKRVDARLELADMLQLAEEGLAKATRAIEEAVKAVKVAKAQYIAACELRAEISEARRA